jgi:hypothetical protein
MSLRAPSFVVAASLVFFPALLGGCTVRTHAGAVHDAPGGWQVLGERTVDGRADHDVIDVGGAEGRFHRISLEAEGSSLELFDVVITFGDGQTYSPGTRLVFDQGARSRVIDLPGGDRVIRRIDFRYGNLAGGGRARMIVRGS